MSTLRRARGIASEGARVQNERGVGKERNERGRGGGGRKETQTFGV